MGGKVDEWLDSRGLSTASTAGDNTFNSAFEVFIGQIFARCCRFSLILHHIEKYFCKLVSIMLLIAEPEEVGETASDHRRGAVAAYRTEPEKCKHVLHVYH